MNIPPFLFQPEHTLSDRIDRRKLKYSFIDKSIQKVAAVISTIYLHFQDTGKNTSIHRIDTRIKLISFLYLIVLTSFVKNFRGELIILFIVIILFILAGIRNRKAYYRIFLFTFIFGVLIFLPGTLNIITEGELIIPIIKLDKSYQFWIYHIPATIGITYPGVKNLVLLTLRVFNSISIAYLIYFTCSFNDLMKALRILYIPNSMVMILSLTFKYIFILAKTTEELYLAIKARLFGFVGKLKLRNIISSRIEYIFKRSVIQYELTYNAMASRGFNGEIIIYNRKRLRNKDFIFLFIIVIAGLAGIFV